MKKIICVDDSQTMRMSLTMLLTELDYEAKAFASGPVLLQALEGGESADLLITDINMPEMDGLTVIREVRKLPACRFLPILVLTTESQQTLRQEAKTAGATGWMVKPVARDTLQGVLRKVLPG